MPRTPTSPSTRRRSLAAWLLTALALAVAGCAERQRVPAERAIAEIEAALAAAGPAPAKYVPGELDDVKSSLAGLKQACERREYGEVVEAAPAVLAAARSLAPTAAAREAELLAELRDEWRGLAQSVPAELAAAAERLDRVAAARRLPDGVTAVGLGAAKGRLRDALALWDRARQEADADRLPEAVTLAHQVREMGRTVDALTGGSPAAAAVE